MTNRHSIPHVSIALLFIQFQAIAPAQPPLRSQDQSSQLASQIVVSGVVVAARQSTLSCRMPQRIVAVEVTENMPVRTGQRLVQFDDAEARAQLNAANAAVDAAISLEGKAASGRAAQKVKADSDVAAARNGLQNAQGKRDQAALALETAVSETAADLKAAEQGVEKAKLSLARATKTLADLEILEKVGGVSRNDLDAARNSASVAQVDFDSSVAGLNRIRQGPGGVPFRVALAQADLDAAVKGVNQAEAGLLSAIAARTKALSVADSEVTSAHVAVHQARVGVNGCIQALAAMRITSPFEGIASSVGAKIGETAQPGAPLVTVVSLNNIRVEALVPAHEISFVHLGMHVSISLETQPGKSIDAVVSGISRVGEPDQRSIRVKFRLTGKKGIRPGLSARVTIGAH